MLSKPAQRKLALYFSGMLVLHGYMWWRVRHAIRAGFPDFSIFYTAARILAAGKATQLYNDNLQESVQRSFAAAVQKRGTILPFNHPPFEAVLFVPFAHLPYIAAYFVWLAFNVVVLFGLLFFLRRHFAILGQAPYSLWCVASLAFAPIFMALVQGQDSILLLLCYAMAFAALQRSADFRAGSWLGLGLFKFNLVLPFVFPLLLAGRKRLVLGFISMAAFLVAVSLAVAGWRGLVSYPNYVWFTERDLKYVWNMPHGNIANLRGMVRALFGALPPSLPNILLFFASASLLAAVTYIWRKAWRSKAPCPPLAFAMGLVATVLLSYHIYVHDLSVLFLAILIVGEFLAGGAPVPEWPRTVLLGCLAILLCSPVYLVLNLRYEQLQVMAWVLLGFVIVLLKVAGSSTNRIATATAPAPASADR